MKARAGIKFFLYCCSSVFISLLLVLPAPAQVKPEVEPNDRREQAQEIRVGENIEGSVQQNNDDEWYKLAVDKPGKNYLQVDLSAVPEIDTYLYIYDANGQKLVEVNDAPQNGAESIIGFPVEPGIYYIGVLGYSKAVKEKYILTTKIIGPWQEDQESEPNDRREQANEIEGSDQLLKITV
jgi:hypothetical protein